jgi:hypothetical protein
MNVHDYDKGFLGYGKLKAELLRLGLAVPGTIRKTYLLCGKKECACASKGGQPHGPYYFWTRKVNGKLTSKSIPKDKLRLYEGWIENRREFERLMKEVLEFGQEIAANLQPDAAIGNSKKRAPSKRGK